MPARRPRPSHPSRSQDGSSRRGPQAPTAVERLTAALIAQMQRGTSPWRQQWDATSGHHVNLFSGRRYRGANPILLSLALAARPSRHPYWCGYAEARAHGLAPRCGVQAVHVLRPQRLQRPAATTAATIAESDDGAAAASGTAMQARQPAVSGQPAAGGAAPPESTWIRYRPVALFHVDDLEGEGLAGWIAARRQAEHQDRRSAPERLAGAEAVLGRWGVPMSEGGERACYWPASDRIQLPERNCFHSGAAFYATWAHEAIHSTGHASRLGRDLSGRIDGGAAAVRAYAREELVAELGAVLLGDRLEIGSDTANHAAYLNHWIALLQESPQLLLRLLSEARQAVDLICPEEPEAAAPAAATTVPSPAAVVAASAGAGGGGE
ncbi:MAG: zincin-like metallopeptidase domain-containing protein [Synechococcus sp.]|nr:zincin-like metallopeptidase domain-containing protein [Synechococcus sp.]